MRRLSSVCFRSLLVLLTIVAAAGMSQHAWAQEVTASITGTVTDPSGAAVPGATVTATSQERGLTFTDVTNDSGLYRIAQLPVGTYTLKVEKSGFALASHAPFVLAVNQVARVDVGMKVGQTSETVEVTGAAPVLETETTQVDTVINAATNDNLPLASRNYVQLTLLAPGAVSTDPSSFNNGNNTGGYGGRPLINGNREQANNFLLDGMDNNQVSDNLLGYTPAPDAIQEFNLITNNAPAEFGNFEGGIVNATIKSGTNSFHGDVWEFFRNDVLNANSWSNNLHVDQITGRGLLCLSRRFAGTCTAARSADRSSRTSCSSSPTIRRSDLTFRVRPARIRCSRRLSVAAIFGALCTDGGGLSTSATAESARREREFSYTTRVHRLPRHVLPFAAAPQRANPFPNNVIPAAMISPVASALFASSLYPSPVGTATAKQRGEYCQFCPERRSGRSEDRL